ncbi:MAG TPA: hypothetical protein VFR51_12320 [Pyrinomonadaceae bacterium]|nr:hypothetical protein [Pyrinomonadaceae bacterium]
MSEDLTKKTPDPDGDLFTLILTIIRRLDKQETILTQIVDRLAKHETILTQILDRLDTLESRVAALESRVGALESRVDAVETRLAVVEKRLDTIEERLESFEQTIKLSVHYVDRGQSVLNDSILKIHVGLLDMDERLRSLEPQRKPTNSQT